MISVRNLLPRLSGSNVVILLLLIGWMFSSCSSAKDTPRRSGTTKKAVTKKRKKRSRTKKAKKVDWAEASKEKNPPITYDGGPRMDKRDSYDVALMIPFDSDSYSAFEQGDGDRFVQFYAGAKLAMKSLEKEGITLNIETLDSKKDFNSSYRQLARKTRDVIIGPYTKDNLMKVAEYGKENEVVVVSPWLASSTVTKENPYYIQLAPGLREMYNVLVDDITKRYNAEQVVILKKEGNKDDARIKYIQEYAASILNRKDTPFQEFEVVVDSLGDSETYFLDLFDPTKETVFLMQNWSFSDEDFIYNTLRKLSAMKGLNKACVYGMPILLNTDRIDYNLYKTMDMRIARSKYVDPNDSSIKEFKRNFYNAYNSLPTDEAYYGYDVMLFTGRAIHKYGKSFQYFLNQDKQDLLETFFSIERKQDKEGVVSDDFRDIEYFLNTHLDIVRMNGNYFEVSNR